MLRVGTRPSEEERRIALLLGRRSGQERPRPPATELIFTDLLRERRADLTSAARQYAQLGIAMSDAFVATSEFELNLLRPVTTSSPRSMRTGAAADGDAAFPEYPSGHLVTVRRGRRGAGTLRAATPRSGPLPQRPHWGPQRFHELRGRRAAGRLSRLYAGIHFPLGHRTRQHARPLHRRAGTGAADALSQARLSALGRCS